MPMLILYSEGHLGLARGCFSIIDKATGLEEYRILIMALKGTRKFIIRWKLLK